MKPLPRIIAPFKQKKEVLALIGAGADELYCGYLDPEWKRAYTYLEFERKGGYSNFNNLAELRESVDLAHSRDIPVYLALNGLYVKEQYPLLLKIIGKLNRIDLDGYIVADIGLLLTLKKEGFKKKIHISTGGTVFNSQAVRFYKKLGAERIIFDRQTTLGTMQEIIKKNQNIDFEAFILYTLCVYIDGFCTFLHAFGIDNQRVLIKNSTGRKADLYLATSYDPDAKAEACCLEYSVCLKSKQGARRSLRPEFYKHLIDGVECGGCAIYDLAKMGIKALKIVGRQSSPEIRLSGVRFIRACLGFLKNNRTISRNDFQQRIQDLYRQTFDYHKKCRGNNCYHPALLYKK